MVANDGLQRGKNSKIIKIKLEWKYKEKSIDVELIPGVVELPGGFLEFSA